MTMNSFHVDKKLFYTYILLFLDDLVHNIDHLTFLSFLSLTYVIVLFFYI